MEPRTLPRRSPIRGCGLYRTAGNRGPAAARNRGISLAQAPLVCTLDSDDLWLPHYLETMANTLDSNPDAPQLRARTHGCLIRRTGRVRKKSAMAFLDPPEPLPDDTRDVSRRAAAAQLRLQLRRGTTRITPGCRRLRRETVDRRGLGALASSRGRGLWFRPRAATAGCVQTTGRLPDDEPPRAAASRQSARCIESLQRTGTPARSFATSHSGCAVQARSAASVAPPPAALLGPLFALRNTLRDSRLWHREPPREVAELLLTIASTQRA